MTTPGAAAHSRSATQGPQAQIGRTAGRQLASVAWFFGLSLGLAALAFAAGIPAAHAAVRPRARAHRDRPRPRLEGG